MIKKNKSKEIIDSVIENAKLAILTERARYIEIASNTVDADYDMLNGRLYEGLYMKGRKKYFSYKAVPQEENGQKSHIGEATFDDGKKYYTVTLPVTKNNETRNYFYVFSNDYVDDETNKTMAIRKPVEPTLVESLTGKNRFSQVVNNFAYDETNLILNSVYSKIYNAFYSSNISSDTNKFLDKLNYGTSPFSNKESEESKVESVKTKNEQTNNDTVQVDETEYQKLRENLSSQTPSNNSVLGGTYCRYSRKDSNADASAFGNNSIPANGEYPDIEVFNEDSFLDK